MKDLLTTVLAAAAMFAFVLSGCTDSPDTAQFSEVTATDNEHPDEDGHAHPTHGPHGGDLIELGNEEYHAELVHPHGHDDDAHAHEEGEAGHKDAHDDHKGEQHADGDSDHADHEHAGKVMDGTGGKHAYLAAPSL